MNNFNIKDFTLNQNYVIEASAGTGKTYNIVEIVNKLVNEEKKDLLTKIKETLTDAKDVVISKRLKDAACCLTTDGAISFEMERVLKTQHHDVKADRILELNPNHPVFAKIEEYYETNEVLANKYVKLLYNQALLSEGIIPEDIKEFSKDICELMI